mgnify:FL=1
MANDWLAGTWVMYYGTLLGTVACLALFTLTLIDAITSSRGSGDTLKNNNIALFIYGTSFLDYIGFLLGAVYFVAGSYPLDSSNSNGNGSGSGGGGNNGSNGSSSGTSTTGGYSSHTPHTVGHSSHSVGHNMGHVSHTVGHSSHSTTNPFHDSRKNNELDTISDHSTLMGDV